MMKTSTAVLVVLTTTAMLAMVLFVTTPSSQPPALFHASLPVEVELDFQRRFAETNRQWTEATIKEQDLFEQLRQKQATFDRLVAKLET
jgi:hypothetical protein